MQRRWYGTIWSDPPQSTLNQSNFSPSWCLSEDYPPSYLCIVLKSLLNIRWRCSRCLQWQRHFDISLSILLPPTLPPTLFQRACISILLNFIKIKIRQSQWQMQKSLNSFLAMRGSSDSINEQTKMLKIKKKMHKNFSLILHHFSICAQRFCHISDVRGKWREISGEPGGPNEQVS